ncbi:ABC-2 transporter permease [Paenibacillus sp. 1011MAR3C5]|uniref:ABC-2 transporter permease n=1 Tax=Paenibacillus sp. 1011MAR3C5 TaxID=1675787 RepID=UPI000E6BF18B|nr:ABC-2 transporter permease [Paenibacillus sp. 1011MAR3C5]RJE86833.1 ABC-2 transporter permease [Paenibacillus sp. 1011MAR3C5]
MSNLYYLIRKDIIVLRWYFLFITAYALVFGVFLQTSFSPLMISMLPAIMMIMFTASMETRNKSMMFIGTLPVSRKQIVSAKYVSVFFYYLLGLVLMAVVHAANQYANEYMMSQSFMVSGINVLLAFGLTMVYAAIYFPVMFWLGVKNSNFIAFLAIFAMVILIGFISNITDKFSDDIFAAGLGIPVVSLLLLYGSFRLSLFIFTRKDMAG